MKETIYKYEITSGAGECRIRMPEFAKILCAQVQRGIPCIWAYVNPSNMSEERLIEVVLTGQFVNPEKRIYIGTIQMNTGFVIHIFEKPIK